MLVRGDFISVLRRWCWRFR